MLVRFALLFALLVPALVGCSRPAEVAKGVLNGDAASTASSPGEEDSPKELTETEKLMMMGQVSCDLKQQFDCDNGVGMVVGIVGNTIRRCTGFLLASDIIVTSASCVPDDLKTAGASCVGRMRVFFPQTNGISPTNGTGCRKVLALSSPTGADERVSSPLAYIQLKKPARKWLLPMKHEPIASGKKLVYPYVEAVDGTANHGVIRVASCTVSGPNVFLPYDDKDMVNGKPLPSALLAVSGCDVKPEGSGAPLIDEDGYVRGVMAQSVPGQLRSSAAAALTALSAPPAITYESIAWAASAACLETPVDMDVDESPRCSLQIATESFSLDGVKGRVARRTENLRNRLRLWQKYWEQQINRGSPSSPLVRFFRWDVIPQTEGALGKTTWVAFPRCFKPLDGWIKNYSSFFGGYSSSASVEESVPSWNVSIGVNSSFGFEEGFEPLRLVTAKIAFSPQNLVSYGKSRVTWTSKSATSDETVTVGYDIPVCND